MTRAGTSAARTAIGPIGTVAVRAVVAGTTALGRAARVRRTTGARTVTTGAFLTARGRRGTAAKRVRFAAGLEAGGLPARMSRTCLSRAISASICFSISGIGMTT
jgi:hypothetical protein